jgi:hypothetical protein
MTKWKGQKDKDNLKGIKLSLYCLSFFYLRLLITSLVPSSFSLSLCPFSFVIVLEKLEDTKQVIRSRK